MIVNKVTGVDFICVNTDAQDLKNNPVNENRKCNIGHNSYKRVGRRCRSRNWKTSTQ
jgi:cell division GTPase FtsZ